MKSARSQNGGDASSRAAGEAKPSALERALDPLVWAWCWLAYWLVMAIPIHWRTATRLLPFAGYYAYSTPSRWRWSERVR